MITMPDAELHSRLREILKRDWIPLPGAAGSGGTGAPGKLLEELLGVEGGNYDTPDAGRWEIKFHSRSALLTLFHLEAEPKGHLQQMVRRFGIPDKQGRTSFRHTIHGRSDKGLYVTHENDRITVLHDSIEGIDWPYWKSDRLFNAFAAKLRRLIVVQGSKRGHKVKFNSAHMYWEPQTSSFPLAIEQGIVAIDFDARTNNGDSLRNHGTKFRIRYKDLHLLYYHEQEFE